MIRKLIQTMVLVVAIPIAGLAAPNIAVAPSPGAGVILQDGAHVLDKVTYTVYLTSGIGDAYEYDTVVQILRTARSSDTVVFIINSPGGYVHTMVMLIDAIEKSKAHTVSEVTGAAASAAAMIMSATDEARVAEGAYVLFHFIQVQGVGGPLPVVIKEMTTLSQAYTPYFKKIMERYLTDAEIEAIFKGEDVIISSEEMNRRIRGNEVKATIKEFFERVRQHAREVVHADKK